MRLIFIQYPPVFILSLAAALLTLSAVRTDKHTFLYAFLAGVATIAMLLLGLYFAVPLTELMGLLLLLVLLSGHTSRHGCGEATNNV